MKDFGSGAGAARLRFDRLDVDLDVAAHDRERLFERPAATAFVASLGGLERAF